jgi:hypothetical protein
MKQLLTLCTLLCMSIFAKASNNVPQATTTIQKADSLAMVQYVGKYKFKDNSILESVNVTIEKGELLAEAEGYMKVKLSPDGATADTFKTDMYDAVVVFVRNDAKEIVGVKLSVQGQEMAADKVKE